MNCRSFVEFIRMCIGWQCACSIACRLTFMFFLIFALLVLRFTFRGSSIVGHLQTTTNSFLFFILYKTKRQKTKGYKMSAPVNDVIKQIVHVIQAFLFDFYLTLSNSTHPSAQHQSKWRQFKLKYSSLHFFTFCGDPLLSHKRPPKAFRKLNARHIQ